ncbi:MAG: hypothetical protein ACE15F_20405 [bacterium]
MDFSQLKRTSIFDRKSLVHAQDTPAPPAAPASFRDFWDALPGHLKVQDLRRLVDAVVQARQKGKPVVFMMGAHSIKVGLSAWIIEALRRKFITALALNGACIVHDFELALAGTTSEDVAESLLDGSFGMTRETGETLNLWIREAADRNRGIGEYLGEKLTASGYPHRHLSLLAAAFETRTPVTVHMALGADVIHHHPEASGAAIGKSSMIDFHRFCDVVSGIGDGGVVVNAGSNVVLPEVFLKALTVARNLCGPIHHFTTANFDMIQHYRPNVNVVQRPILGGGQGFAFTGHHEIMLPLFFMALFEAEKA